MNCSDIITVTQASKLLLNLDGLHKLYQVIDGKDHFITSLPLGTSSTDLLAGEYKVCDATEGNCGEILFQQLDDSSIDAESDPVLVCDINDSSIKFWVHPRYEDGVFVGWFNSAGDEVAEGVDFQKCENSNACCIFETKCWELEGDSVQPTEIVIVVDHHQGGV